MTISKLISTLREAEIALRLEGEQLHLEDKHGRLTEQLIGALRENKQALLAWLSTQQKLREEDIPAASDRHRYPASKGQQRMWVIQQMDPASTMYNIAEVIHLPQINMAIMESALLWLIKRHQVLQTTFAEHAGQLYQQVSQSDRLPLRYTPVTGENQQEEAGRMVAQELSKAFDLATGPLFKIEVLQLKDQDWLILHLHHIITDGWSIDVLKRELMGAYASIERGEQPQAPALSFQFGDFAAWQHGLLRDGHLNTQRAFWLQELGGDLPKLQLPVDRQRPAIKGYSGAYVTAPISPQATEQLRKLAMSQKSSVFNVLLSIVNVLLYRYSGQQDLLIGIPVSGRSHPQLENQLGLYTNTVVLRTQLDKTQSFEQVLQQVTSHMLEVIDHQDYPFDQLIDDLNPARDLSRSPLFDVMVSLQQEPEGQAPTEIREGNRASHFDLTLYFREHKNSFSVDVVYATELFDPWRIKALAGHLNQLIIRLGRQPQLRPDLAEFCEAGERRRMLQEFNDYAQPLDTKATVVDHILRQVQKTPDALALKDPGQELNYAAFDAWSDSLAATLQQQGINHGDNIIIYMGRTCELVVAVLAAWKCGATYIPVDLSFPQDRVMQILEDSEAPVVLSTSNIIPLDGLNILNVDLLPRETEQQPEYSLPTQEDIAYMIFTSGTTGRPKGVRIPHRNLLNCAEWMLRHFDITAVDRSSLYCGISFDVTIMEMYAFLMVGASLHGVPDDIRIDMLALSSYFEQEEITFCFLPTPAGEQFIEMTDNHSLRVLYVGGDKLHIHRDRDYRIINIYGPTENTVVSTWLDVKQWEPNIPIGIPVDNHRCYVVQHGTTTMQPIGIPGELCVAGDGVAAGYFKRPELTEKSFIANPFEPGRVMYRTGDLVRWRPDGLLEYLGRMDNQVKIRGYRIEIGDIESTLLNHEQVKEAVVVVKGEGQNKYLVAYIVASCEEQELREYLTQKLPSYMSPGFWVMLDKLPTNSNGKVDKRSLPEPQAQTVKAEPLQSELDHSLAALWASVLNIPESEITRSSDFFALGGHSLKVNRLVQQINAQFQCALHITDIFRLPLLSQQAEEIAHAGTEVAHEPITEAPEANAYPVTHAQRRFYILSELEGNALSFHIPLMQELRGEIDSASFEAGLSQVVARHEALRTSFGIGEDGNIEQYIADTLPALPLRYHDLSKKPQVREAFLSEAQRFHETPIPMHTPGLWRLTLYKLGDGHYAIQGVFHHIIFDGSSAEIFLRDLQQAIAGEQLSPLSVQNKDYAYWQQSHEALFSESKRFWKEQFEGEIPQLELATDRPRKAVKGNRGAVVQQGLPQKAISQLKAYSAAHGGTLFMGLTTLLNAFLHRMSNQQDIVIGTPVAGREHPQLAGQIGTFVNTLALRNQLSPTESFSVLFQRVKESTLAAYKHQSYPFDKLVDELDLRRDQSRNPLFDVMLALNNYQEYKSARGVKGESMPGASALVRTAPFDLTFTVQEGNEETLLAIEYDTDLFEAETMHFYAAEFAHLLEQCMIATATAVASLSWHTASPAQAQPGLEELLGWQEVHIPAHHIASGWHSDTITITDNVSDSSCYFMTAEEALAQGAAELPLAAGYLIAGDPAQAELLSNFPHDKAWFILPFGESLDQGIIKRLHAPDGYRAYGNAAIGIASETGQWLPDKVVGQLVREEDQKVKASNYAAYRTPQGTISLVGTLASGLRKSGKALNVRLIEEAITVLTGSDDIALRVVSPRHSEQQLIAYLTGEEVPALQEAMHNKLPAHMIPDHFCFVEKISRDGEGVADWTVLPGWEQLIAARLSEAVTADSEQELAAIWSTVLQVPQDTISRQSQFFEMGGNSVKAIQLQAAIYRNTGRQVPVREIYHRPVLAEQAALLNASTVSDKPRQFVLKQGTTGMAPVYLLPPVTGSPLVYQTLVSHLPTGPAYIGLQYPGFDDDTALPDSIETIARVLLPEIEVSEREPVTLIAYSFGGLVGFELARLLEARGVDCRLQLIDVANPATQEVMHWNTDTLDYLRTAFADMGFADPEQAVGYVQHLNALMEAYRLQGSLRAPIHAIEAEPLQGQAAEMHFWSEYTGQFTHSQIKGNHFQIIEEPHVQPLAEQVQASLQLSNM